MRDSARRAIALILCAPALVWTAELLVGTSPLLLAAAAGPAALLSAILLATQRGAGRPPAALAFSFLWGATAAAWASTTGNELARPWIDAYSTGDDRVLTALLVAPLLEEAAKALGLVFLLFLARDRLRDARDGIVYGALIGVGFVLTENLLYLGVAMLQGGEAGLVRSLWLRGILGASAHAVFTACAGAAIGRWADVRPRQPLAPLFGFLAAHSQHVVWNALAAPAMASALCGSTDSACRDVPTGFAVFGISTAIAFGFLLPGLVLVVAAWREASGRSRPAGAAR